MSQTVDSAIDELLLHYYPTTVKEMRREIKHLVLAVCEAKNKQAASIYGKLKYFLQSVIKLGLLQAIMPKIEYYARGFQCEADRSPESLK